MRYGRRVTLWRAASRVERGAKLIRLRLDLVNGLPPVLLHAERGLGAEPHVQSSASAVPAPLGLYLPYILEFLEAKISLEWHEAGSGASEVGDHVFRERAIA